MAVRLKIHTRLLPPKEAELLQDHVESLEVWIRSPNEGEDFLRGFTCAKLYELPGTGAIGWLKGNRFLISPSMILCRKALPILAL